MSDEETIAVPRKATFGMKTAATGFAMQSCITSSYSWHDYMSDLWAVMVAHAPVTLKPAVESVKAERDRELIEIFAAKTQEIDRSDANGRALALSYINAVQCLRALTEGEG